MAILVRDALVEATTVSAAASAAEADLLAEHRGAHYLLVSSNGALVGVVCRCTLREHRSEAWVGRLVGRPPIFVRDDDGIDVAMRFMDGCRVGCLVVCSDDGRVLGVVTREDLTRDEADGGSRPACVTCGAVHGLETGLGDAIFCADCLAHATRTSSTDDSYFTLGDVD